MVYDKAKADGVALEKLGTERFGWPSSRYGRMIGRILESLEVAGLVRVIRLFAESARQRLVLEGGDRDAVRKLDPTFGYAERFDEAPAAIETDLGENPRPTSCCRGGARARGRGARTT